jgi:hypothetical protein
LIQSIPAMWDETVVLSQSQLGQTTALARRKGQDWYLAVMNVSARSLSIPLVFLAPNVTYRVCYVRDTSSSLEYGTQVQGNSFPVFSNAGGGEVAWFSPIATNYPPATLQIERSNSAVKLTWSQGTLLETTNLASQWTTSNATSPLLLTPAEPQKFYRVQSH